MQVCRFHEPGAGPCLGIVHAERVYNATQAGLCHSLTELLSHANPLAFARSVVERVPASYRLEELDRQPTPNLPHLLAPIDRQEVWAAGVSYMRSRDARVVESKASDVYTLVYGATRPELFFKATPFRTVGPNAPVMIRSDSRWDVPEPELAVVLSPDLRVIGFTIGDDVSSRSIEGENPLYLPQAKVYMGSCALGPVIELAEQGTTEPGDRSIRLTINRAGGPVFQGETSTARMKRSVEELVTYLGRSNRFPDGAVLLTGTGIVPPEDFTLQPGDEIVITIDGLGTLRNPVERI